VDDAIEIRPFASGTDYEGMVDYFVTSSESFLLGMGVEVSKLPTREAWLEDVLADHERADPDRNRFYVAWLVDGELVGHSSISHITFGQTANCHMHMWRPTLRRSGHGVEFMARSIDLYFTRFRLMTLGCEPYAENPAPNAALTKLGFKPTRRFRTVPSKIAIEQEVQRYEVSRDRWFDMRAGS